jgi:hypothetical protein
MEDGNPDVSLESLMGGEIIDRFRYEFNRVMENVADPNTTLAKRGITIKVEVKPNKSRTQNDVKVKFSIALAPTEPMETTVYLSMTKKGLVASEYNPKQPNLPEVLASVGAINASNVTQLRSAGGEA